MLTTDEATLARALALGDSSAAWAAWHRFAPRVRRTIQRFMGSGADVEDVVQQVFVCFFERIATLQEPQALNGFLIAIALNVARAEARRNRVRRTLWQNWVAPPSSVHPDPEAREAFAHLCAILRGLRPADAAVLVERFVDNDELAEMASSRGVSLSTIKRRLTRIAHRFKVQAKRDPALSHRISGP